MRRLPLSLLAVLFLFALVVLAVALPASATVPRDGPPGDASGRDRDIVAWWNFGNPHGSVVLNRSGGGMNGINHGAAWEDGALEFNGVDDYVNVRQFRKLGGLSTGTISVWFNAYTAKFGQYVQPLLYFGDADGGPDNTSMTIELGHFYPDRKTSAIYFTIFTVPGAKPTFCFDTLFDVELNTWHHFVAVVGENWNTGYLDGVELTGRYYNFGGPNDSVFLDEVPDPGVFTIGKGFFAYFTDPSYFDGSIGDVRIYSRPLGADEVVALYDELRDGGDSRTAAGPKKAAALSSGREATLLGASPNPFNPATRIRFAMPERSLATMRVFSADGRLVATLLNEEVAAGPREVEWNGTDAAGRAVRSGVYFCRLEAAGRTVTSKLVLDK